MGYRKRDLGSGSALVSQIVRLMDISWNETKSCETFNNAFIPNKMKGKLDIFLLTLLL